MDFGFPFCLTLTSYCLTLTAFPNRFPKFTGTFLLTFEYFPFHATTEFYGSQVKCAHFVAYLTVWSVK